MRTFSSTVHAGLTRPGHGGAVWNRRLVAVLAAGTAALLVALAIGLIARPADRPTPDTIWLRPGSDAPEPTDRDGIEVVPPPVRLDPTTTAAPVTAPPPAPAPPAPAPPSPEPGDDDDDDGGFEPDDDDDDDGVEPDDDGDDDDGDDG